MIDENGFSAMILLKSQQKKKKKSIKILSFCLITHCQLFKMKGRTFEYMPDFTLCHNVTCGFL